MLSGGRRPSIIACPRRPTLAEHALLNAVLHEQEAQRDAPPTVGRQRGKGGLAELVKTLEASFGGVGGKEVEALLARVRIAAEASLQEGMHDEDAAQVYQALPVARALPVSAAPLQQAEAWMAARPQLLATLEAESASSVRDRKPKASHGRARGRRGGGR